MITPNPKVESQLRLANVELNRRIALLEKKLSEKERTERKRQGAANHYQRLFESARDGILIVDAETGEVVEVNPSLLELLGYLDDELCGKYIWEIAPLKKIVQTRDAFKKLKENQYIRYEDVLLETCEGISIPVEFISTVHLAEQKEVVLCSLRDITALKLAEAERKRLLTAIEQADEGIVMTDAQGVIDFVNPAYEQATGYTREELLGRNLRILSSGWPDDLFFRQLHDTISERETWKGQIINKRKDGTLYTGETTISPVFDASGRMVSYVAVQRVVQQPQVAPQKQHRLKMEAVGLLAEGISHEYNNLLSVIIGYTELALEKVTPSQSLHADLEFILKAAKRSADVTRQLLAFARQQMIIPQVFDLNQCIENMLPMLRQFIGDSVQLSWRPNEEPLHIKMDPIQIGQILTNLCTNAREAISGDGKITIETKKVIIDQTFHAHHAKNSGDEYVLLIVSDDGCGMEKELVDKIFEPFFTNKRVGQGTGLGLSMVHSIVQQNKGFIEAYSEQGTGTTFRLYLPRHISHPGLPPNESPMEIPLGCGEMVLVVDDELHFLTIAKRILEKLGYRVLTAGTTGKAIELTEANCNEIRLLIADMIMPEMNGRCLAERLRCLCPDLKVLFMSGYTASMIIDQGLLSEDLNFIQKPFLANDLAVKVRDALKAN